MQPQPQAPSSTQNAVEPQSIISVQNVTVAYRSYKERPSSLKESVIRFMRTGKFAGSMTMEALSNVTLTIPKGAVYGLIGSNGSGKSTMLKVLAQVLKPTGGTVRVRGTVASLIELGVGFDPELNAVENIYLNGSLHKRSRAQIKSRVESIIEFAELREFATTPIKYYSSGMAARLGFSVAIEIDPDILLVDEILAVGDERFQVKCMEVFHRLLREGKTIVIVSHDLDMIARTASRIGLLSRGHLVFDGDPRTAVQMYRDSSYQTALTHS